MIRFSDGHSSCFQYLEDWRTGDEYRRFGYGVWERAYGDSWEKEYDVEALEKAYDVYLLKFKEDDD